ncbi:MAG: protein TolQ [Desulfobulbaceae bacterium]|nr:protein TolQ [Desulfobulbaceae bacterium]
MFFHAGPIVKFVMLLLLCFSLGSWYIIFKKHLLFKAARHASENFLDMFWQSKNLSEAHKAAQDGTSCPESVIFTMGYTELKRLGKSRTTSGEGMEETLEMRLAGMNNLTRTLDKGGSIEMYRLGKHLSFLATTGSATPFIGLFGTVWGIMTSFHEIGIRGSASLSVVAPGISEALIATAAGLAVAIPAVIFYNYYTNLLEDMESNMQSFSSDFLNLVERDLIAKT